MPQTKQASKRQKRLREAVPVVGAVGVSLSLAGSASAAGVVGPAPDSSAQGPALGQIILNEEEIADVSLGTFYVFDKENGGARATRPTSDAMA